MKNYKEYSDKELDLKLDALMNEEPATVKTTKETNKTGRMESETVYTVECENEAALVTIDADEVYKDYTVSVFDERFNYPSFEKVKTFAVKLDAKKYAFSLYKAVLKKYTNRAQVLNADWKEQGIIA